MLQNLKVVLFGKGITIKAYASYLGVSEKTAQNKISGKSPFTYPEVIKTCELLPEYNMDYLFSCSKPVA